jgi:hypothetical protein
MDRAFRFNGFGSLHPDRQQDLKQKKKEPRINADQTYGRRTRSLYCFLNILCGFFASLRNPTAIEFEKQKIMQRRKGGKAAKLLIRVYARLFFAAIPASHPKPYIAKLSALRR